MMAWGRHRAGQGLFSGRVVRGALGILPQLRDGRAKEVPGWVWLKNRVQVILGLLGTCFVS